MVDQAVTAQLSLDISKEKCSIPEIIQNQIKLAESKGDWDRVLKLLGISRRLVSSSGGGYCTTLEGENLAVRSYLEGRNLEDAGQWAEAVKAYQDAVRKVGENVPRAEAKARLEALAKSHPEAWGK